MSGNPYQVMEFDVLHCDVTNDILESLSPRISSFCDHESICSLITKVRPGITDDWQKRFA